MSSRFGGQQKWDKLVNRWNLNHEEQDKIHRHLGRNYSVEKDDMEYKELEVAASEVVSRIEPGKYGN